MVRIDKLFLRYAVRKFVIRFLLLFFIAGIVALAFGIRSAARELQLARRGQWITATVLDKRTSGVRASRPTSYVVTYEFAPPGGAPIRNTDSVSAGEWSRLSRGNHLDIVYLKDNPARNATGPSWTESLLLASVGAVFVIVPVAGVMIALPDLRREFDRRESRKRRRARKGTADAAPKSAENQSN